MTPVSVIEGAAYPLGLADVDTDMIIASDWLKTISRCGLGAGLFEALRAGGASAFDDPRFAGATILIAGRNFGCGSSREHAVWALLDFGIKAVIAASFSDIFASNAFKNGLLTAALDEPEIARLLAAAPVARLTVDLEQQTVASDQGDRFAFGIDPFHKHCLLGGLDEIALTEAAGDAIARYERTAARDRPFLGPGAR